MRIGRDAPACVGGGGGRERGGGVKGSRESREPARVRMGFSGRLQEAQVAGWGALVSLSFSNYPSIQRNKSFRRKVERDWSGVWAWGLFFRTRKNELEPGKIEVGMTESLNSNSFDLNSNDLNRK